MTPARGQTLMEIAMSLGLLSMIFLFMLNIVPLGYLTLRKSHLKETATALALYRADEVAFMPTLPTNSTVPYAFDNSANVTVDLYDTSYQMAREFYNVDPYRTDVVVSVENPSLGTLHFGFRVARGQ